MQICKPVEAENRKEKDISGMISDRLHPLGEEEDRMKTLKRSIQEGMESGIAKTFDLKKHLESLKASKRKMGK